MLGDADQNPLKLIYCQYPYHFYNLTHLSANEQAESLQASVLKTWSLIRICVKPKVHFCP